MIKSPLFYKVSGVCEVFRVRLYRSYLTDFNVKSFIDLQGPQIRHPAQDNVMIIFEMSRGHTKAVSGVISFTGVAGWVDPHTPWS